MDSLGRAASNLAQSRQQLTDTSSDSSARHAEIAKFAKLLLGCYRTGEANDPEVYTAAVIAILSTFPIDIVRQVVDPRTGIPSRVKWLPSPSEVMEACRKIEEERKAVSYAQQWEARSREQLREREELERVERPKQSYAEFLAEMAERGLPINDRHRRHFETTDSVKVKLGISDEQWDSLPDLPQQIGDKSSDRLDRR